MLHQYDLADQNIQRIIVDKMRAGRPANEIERWQRYRRLLHWADTVPSLPLLSDPRMRR